MTRKSVSRRFEASAYLIISHPYERLGRPAGIEPAFNGATNRRVAISPWSPWTLDPE